MTIDTKYNIDDYVWLIGNGCLEKKRIISIDIQVISKTGTANTKYHLDGKDIPMSEHLIHASKEALLQSL